jgi:hypothetical protein
MTAIGELSRLRKFSLTRYLYDYAGEAEGSAMSHLANCSLLEDVTMSNCLTLTQQDWAKIAAHGKLRRLSLEYDGDAFEGFRVLAQRSGAPLRHTAEITSNPALRELSLKLHTTVSNFDNLVGVGSLAALVRWSAVEGNKLTISKCYIKRKWDSSIEPFAELLRNACLEERCGRIHLFKGAGGTEVIEAAV